MELIKFLSAGLQDSVEEVTLLLIILQYLASEYDDEDIVIEQSLVDSFSHFLAKMSPTVFTQILNYWATKL